MSSSFESFASEDFTACGKFFPASVGHLMAQEDDDAGDADPGTRGSAASTRLQNAGAANTRHAGSSWTVGRHLLKSIRTVSSSLALGFFPDIIVR